MKTNRLNQKQRRTILRTARPLLCNGVKYVPGQQIPSGERTKLNSENLGAMLAAGSLYWSSEDEAQDYFIVARAAKFNGRKFSPGDRLLRTEVGGDPAVLIEQGILRR